MSRKPLLFLLSLSLLALTALGPSRARAADISGDLAYVPATAFAVVGVDGDRLRRSPVYRRAIRLTMADRGIAKELKELRSAIGVDLLAQTHAVLFAFDPKVVTDEDHFVMIAEARVSESRLVGFIRSKGTKLEPKQGPSGRYYLIGKRGKGALAVRGGRIILGGRDSFARALQKRGPSAALRTALGRVRGHDLFVAALPTPAVRRKLEREHRGFGAVDRLVASADLNAGLRLAMAARMLRAAAARDLAAEANRTLSQARGEKQTGKLGLLGLISAIQITSSGRELRARIDLPAKELAGMLSMIETLLLH